LRPFATVIGRLKPTPPSNIRTQNTTLSATGLRNLLQRRCTYAIVKGPKTGYLIELFYFWYNEFEYFRNIEVNDDTPEALVQEIDEHIVRIKRHLVAIQEELEELLFSPEQTAN
jgi:hypothetical protein